MKTLFIRNLPFDTSETELRKAFECYGKVQRCSIAKNRETGESRGFGFVDIEDGGAAKAIAEMNGKMFSNRSIVVQESEPRNRPAGGAPSSGGGGSASSAPRPSGGPGGGARPPQSRPGGSNNNSGPLRPGGQQRTAGAPNSRTAYPMSRTASRPGMGGDPNKHFGPDAAPAAERFKQYRERPKDRLTPYKREHFDFRESLDESEGGPKKPGVDDENVSAPMSIDDIANADTGDTSQVDDTQYDGDDEDDENR
ncbi:MAG: RNA recognition motif domain-containing protein [Planctomycetota bacterium]